MNFAPLETRRAATFLEAGIALFRQGGEKPIEFTGFGMHLKGAAGEIVLWVLCFLSITGGIALLWRN